MLQVRPRYIPRCCQELFFCMPQPHFQFHWEKDFETVPLALKEKGQKFELVTRYSKAITSCFVYRADFSLLRAAYLKAARSANVKAVEQLLQMAAEASSLEVTKTWQIAALHRWIVGVCVVQASICRCGESITRSALFEKSSSLVCFNVPLCIDVSWVFKGFEFTLRRLFSWQWEVYGKRRDF